jgi:putative endonuclease
MVLPRIRDRCVQWFKLNAIARWLPHKKSLGQRGERAAERYLRRSGMTIVARGVRTAWGEIDLIAVDGQTIVFVEVKTRRSTVAGTAEEAVTPEKQRRLTRLALAYLRRHDLLECSARFDVVAVTWRDGVRRPQISHYRRAFEPTGSFQFFA